MLTASEFWRLSQALYAAPGVSELCLQAQDEAGAEINLLLLLALLQARGWRGSYRTLLANISHLRNDSNIAIYQYRRSRGGIGVRYAF